MARRSRSLHAELTREIRESPPGPKVGAFFDVDRTLLAGFSAVAFVREQLLSGRMGPSEIDRDDARRDRIRARAQRLLRLRHFRDRQLPRPRRVRPRGDRRGDLREATRRDGVPRGARDRPGAPGARSHRRDRVVGAALSDRAAGARSRHRARPLHPARSEERRLHRRGAKADLLRRRQGRGDPRSRRARGDPARGQLLLHRQQRRSPGTRSGRKPASAESR